MPFFSMAASEFVEAIVGVGAVARARPVRAGEGGRAGDRLHRRARRDRPLAHVGRRRLQRRQRRARADAEPDPDRDGRLRLVDQRDRDRARPTGPTSSTRRCCGPGRFDRRVAVQPPDRAGREAILEVHTRGVPLARRRRPRPDRRDDAGHGRRRPREPRQRGGAARRAARATSRSSEADFTDALERIVLGAERQVMMSPRGPAPHRLPRGRPRDRRDAHAGRRPGAQGLDHPARAWRSASRSRRPRRDRFNYREPELRAKIKVALGGRAAEEVVFGEITHRRRVGHPAADRDRAPDGRPLGHERRRSARSPCCPRDGAGPAAARRRGGLAATRSSSIDEEVRRIVDECARARSSTLLQREPRQARLARRRRCSSTRRSTRTTPTRPPACRIGPSRSRTRRGSVART